MKSDDAKFKIENFNDDFLLIKSLDRDLVRALGNAIFAKKLDYAFDLIVAESEICIKLNRSVNSEDLDKIRNLKLQVVEKGPSYVLPVYFDDHQDWIGIQDHCQKSKEELVHDMIASQLSVVMYGFLPGFSYLDGLPSHLHIPRKAIPSKKIEASSVALGGKYLGIYTIESPGGWHVVGRTPVQLIDLSALPPAQMEVQSRVTIQEINKSEYDSILTSKVTLKTYNKNL